MAIRLVFAEVDFYCQRLMTLRPSLKPGLALSLVIRNGLRMFETLLFHVVSLFHFYSRSLRRIHWRWDCDYSDLNTWTPNGSRSSVMISMICWAQVFARSHLPEGVCNIFCNPATRISFNICGVCVDIRFHTNWMVLDGGVCLRLVGSF